MSLRVALALGSGGARGYAHIGVINALQARGHEIVSVAGSSMGAVVGGAFASGSLESYTDWLRGLSQRDVLRQLDPSLSTAGMLRAEKVLGNMVELVGDRLIEDLPVRFTAVAVDLLAGREVWLDEGPLDRAVRASIGIPGVITPAVVNGRLLVDGGVLNPVPVAATATAHADVVVAVSLQGQRARNAGAMPTRETAERRPSVEWWDRFRSNAAGVLASDTMASLTQRLGALVAGTGQVGPNGDTDAPPSISMFEALSLSLDASQSALTRYCLAAHAPDVLISVPKDACRTLDFHKATEMIEIGRKLADEAFDSAQL